uniref:Ig-like domain-containing protein n=1 Tax=Hippocampus comes TaxID=109280 RepID=A0A3Q3DL09_HIPCM
MLKMRMALHLLLLLLPYEGKSALKQNGDVRTLAHISFFCVCVLFRSGCTSGPTFKTEIVAVGQSVSLRCPRDSARVDSLFWIRLVSGAFPEFLAQTSTSDLPKSLTGESNEVDHITAGQEPRSFVLHIRPVQKSDMAVYYCLHGTPWLHKITFLTGTFLQVIGNYDNLQGLGCTADKWLPMTDFRGLRCKVFRTGGRPVLFQGHIHISSLDVACYFCVCSICRVVALKNLCEIMC